MKKQHYPKYWNKVTDRLVTELSQNPQVRTTCYLKTLRSPPPENGNRVCSKSDRSVSPTSRFALGITGCFGSTDQLCFKYYAELYRSGCGTTSIGVSGPASMACIGEVLDMMLLVLVKIVRVAIFFSGPFPGLHEQKSDIGRFSMSGFMC